MKSPAELKSLLRGIIGFGVTPFDDNFNIHDDALRRNSASLAECCEVIVPLGNNGEVFSLSPAEQQHVGSVVVDEVRGRKPVVAGIGPCLPVALELARAAESYGADGVILFPPTMAEANDEGLFQYFSSIARAVRIGVVLFQTRSFNFSAQLLVRLAEIENIVGLKDEHGDMDQFVRQRAAVGDRIELLCGVGEILAPSYFAIGVRAFTSGIVNFAPRLSRTLLNLLLERKLLEAAKFVETNLIPVFELRRKRKGYATTVIKEAMNLCGQRMGPVRPPLSTLPDEDREALSVLLARLEVPILSTSFGPTIGTQQGSRGDGHPTVRE